MERRRYVDIYPADMSEAFIDNMKRICGERKQSFRNELSMSAVLLPQQYYQSEEPVYIVNDDIGLQFL